MKTIKVNLGLNERDGDAFEVVNTYQITKKEAKKAMTAFRSGRKTFIPDSPKMIHMVIKQTWANRERDDD